MQSPAMRIFARKRDARGFAENKVAARKGGGIAGEAREKLEQDVLARPYALHDELAED